MYARSQYKYREVNMRKSANTLLFTGGTKAKRNPEDMTIGRCLSEVGIRPKYTRDSLDRERFHSNPLGFMLNIHECE